MILDNKPGAANLVVLPEQISMAFATAGVSSKASFVAVASALTEIMGTTAPAFRNIGFSSEPSSYALVLNNRARHAAK